MRRLVIVLVSIAALMGGLYLSAQHFAVALPEATPTATGGEVGSLRPDFLLASNLGEMVSADAFAGKTILINFWATWCGPCREEMPMLMDLQRKHTDKGLQIVGIALDDANAVKNFVKTYGITYPILVGESDVFETSAAYGNSEGVLPFSVLIDKNGIIRWQYAGKITQKDINVILVKAGISSSLL
jgi:thiol-disulfide isomerase/thioredoxin